MTTRTKNISALNDRAQRDLEKIIEEYERSLHAKAIDPELRIDIKNLCGNLRSVLDYLAHDIREKFCPTARHDRFYFPILQDQRSFDLQIDSAYPGLRNASPSLTTYLNNIQPFKPDYGWLGAFNRLNNENKHGDLVEQTRAEVTETRVTGQEGGMISWGPGVTFGSGVSIMGVPVDPGTQLPVPHPSIQVEKITWVDFRFVDFDVSALALLKQAVEGIQKITSEVAVYL